MNSSDALPLGPIALAICAVAGVVIMLAAHAEWTARERHVRRSDPAVPGLGQRIRGVMAANRALLWNTGTLITTSGVGAVLGFAFWVAAARLFPQETVGYAAAAVSAMSLLATLSLLGLGLLLVREIPRRRRSGGLVVASAILAATAAGAAVLLFVGFAAITGSSAAAYVRDPAGASWFAAGVLLTTIGFLLDQAVIGRLWGGVQLWRNAVLHVGKLSALLIAAPLLDDRYGVGILAAWVVAAALSVVIALAILVARGVRLFQRPDWVLTGRMRSSVGSHFLLEIAGEAPRFAVPLLVTALISATTNAAFFAAWILLSLAHIIPYHLSSVLVAVGAGNPSRFAEKVRFTLRASLAVGLVVVPLVVVGAAPILSVFGESYSAEAALPLQIMALSFFPVAFQALFVTIGRVKGQVWRTALIFSGFFALEIGAIAAGILIDGLRGLALAFVVVKTVEALLIAPVVLRVAREGAVSEVPGKTRTVPLRAASAYGPVVVATPAVQPDGGAEMPGPAPAPSRTRVPLRTRVSSRTVDIIQAARARG